MLASLRNKRLMTTATFAGAFVFATVLATGLTAADQKKPDPKAASKTDSKATTQSDAKKKVTVTVKTQLHEIFKVTFPGQSTLEPIDLLTSAGHDINNVAEGTEVKWKAEPIYLARSEVWHCGGTLKVDSTHRTIEPSAANCDKHEIQHFETAVETLQKGIQVEVKFRSLNYSDNPSATINHPARFGYLPDLDGKAKLSVTAFCSDVNGGPVTGADSHDYETAHPVPTIYVIEGCKLSLERPAGSQPDKPAGR
jgi:hypothetical protein